MILYLLIKLIYYLFLLILLLLLLLLLFLNCFLLNKQIKKGFMDGDWNQPHRAFSTQ